MAHPHRSSQPSPGRPRNQAAPHRLPSRWCSMIMRCLRRLPTCHRTDWKPLRQAIRRNCARFVRRRSVPSPRADAGIDGLCAENAAESARHSDRRHPRAGDPASRPRCDSGPGVCRCSTSPARRRSGTSSSPSGPGVFIPRPETELLVGWGLARRRRHREPLVVDLCAGRARSRSSVAHERPGATRVRRRAAPAALQWLRRNAARATGDRGSSTATPPAPRHCPTLDGLVDLVLCNPPYVPDGFAGRAGGGRPRPGGGGVRRRRTAWR